jgi:tetratricopeptide (TPR) repeat protein
MNTKIKITLINSALITLVIANMFRSSKPSELMSLSAYPFKIEEEERSTAEIAFYEKKKQKKISAIELAILGESYLSEGKVQGNAEYFVEAEKNANLSLAKIPEPNHAAQILLAKIYENRHDFNKTLEITQKLLAANPNDQGALKIATSTHLALGNFVEAEMAAARLTLHSASPGNYTLSALVAIARGKDDIAEKLFISALKTELGGSVRDSAWIRSMVARFCIERNRRDEARQFLEESIRIMPSNPLAFSLLGDLEYLAQNYENAAKNYMTAFEQSKQSLHLIGYAKAQKELGMKELATSILNEAEALVRNDLQKSVGHRLELATLLLEKDSNKDLSEALDLALSEIKLRKTPQSYFILAKSLGALNNWKSAREIMDRILPRALSNQNYSEYSHMIDRRLSQGKLIL